jgi:hypothetical protein
MKIAAFLALILAAAPAFAAPGQKPDAAGKPVWESDLAAVPIHGCSSQETKEIRAALDIGARYAKECLGTEDTPGLAPDIGQKILDALDRREVDFTCKDSSDGTEGETTFDAQGAHVEMVSWPPPALADPEAADFGGAALHELIHAVDPAGAFMTSVDAHNQGFADRVYACHAACEGKIRPGVANNLTMLELALGGKLPQSKGYRCKNNGYECEQLRKFAYICTAGGAAKVLKGAKVVEKRIVAAKCLQKAVYYESADFACNESVCLNERAAFLQESAAMGIMPAREWVDAQGERYSAIAKAAREDDPRGLKQKDLALLAALAKAGTLKGCGAAP